MTKAPKSRSPSAEVRVPQQARSRRTRARILDAAAGVFEKGGYDETTTAEIARQAGVAVGSIYSYFADKRAILLELLDETVAQMGAEVVAELAPERWRDVDLREKVRALVETVLKTRRLRPGVQRILWERYFKDPQVHEAFEAIENEIVGAIEQLLSALVAEGRVPAQDTTSAAFVIHTSVEWISARLMLGGAPDEVVNAAVETTSKMIAQLILGDANDAD